jgi:hypothetical protein
MKRPVYLCTQLDTVQVIHVACVCLCILTEAADSSTLTSILGQCCKL